MSQVEATKTSLGPGQQILDPNFLTQIQNTPALSPSDLLKIATFYKGLDLANYLFLIALTLATSNLENAPASVPLAPPVALPPTPPVASPSTLLSSKASAIAAPAAMAAAANPIDEWNDQVEDFLRGNIDAEDSPKGTVFRLIIGVVDIRWLPFSTSLPGFGLLVETTSNTFSAPVSYIIGFSPDPRSLPTE